MWQFLHTEENNYFNPLEIYNFLIDFLRMNSL